METTYKELILPYYETLFRSCSEVLFKYGQNAAFTDLAISTGGRYSIDTTRHDDNSLRGRTGDYYTSSKVGYFLRGANGFGNAFIMDPDDYVLAIRPVLLLPGDEFKKVILNKKEGYMGTY